MPYSKLYPKWVEGEKWWRLEINIIETEQIIDKNYENKNWFVINSNKIDELLGRVIKENRERKCELVISGI